MIENRKPYRSFIIFAFSLALLICFPLSGLTQSDSTKRPSVGDHIFTPVTYSNLPFTNTYFYTMIGYGQTTDLVHSIDWITGGSFRGLHGEVTFLDLGFAYQQRVRDWLAAYVNFDVSARVGTELQSILSQGVNTLTSFDLGWHIKLLEGDRVALSATFELENNEGSFINVLGFVQDVINNLPNPSLSEKVPLLAAGTGLRFAYGLNDFIGFKFSTDIAYGESYTRGENAFTYSTGAGVDLDFNPRYSIPVGVVFFYSISSMPDLVIIKDKTAQMARLKIAYTKAFDFNLGVEYSYMKMPFLNQERPPTVQSFSLVARYYF
jgi:hypothetical protein